MDHFLSSGNKFYKIQHASYLCTEGHFVILSFETEITFLDNVGKTTCFKASAFDK